MTESDHRKEDSLTAKGERSLELPLLASLAMAVATETLAIALGGAEHSFPIFSFLDRRTRKPQRKQWVLVRAVERLLYGVTEGSRSTGRFALHLGKCSMAESVLVCDKAAIEEEVITQDEFDAGTSSQGSLHGACCSLPCLRARQSLAR